MHDMGRWTDDSVFPLPFVSLTQSIDTLALHPPAPLLRSSSPGRITPAPSAPHFPGSSEDSLNRIYQRRCGACANAPWQL